MKKFDTPICVTRPYLPSIERYKEGLQEIWQNQWLSNNGPMLERFHARLAAYLDVPETNLTLLSNGTLALELAFQAMELADGEVITTPFTFVATSHALKRIGAIPVFADIDPKTCCLSPTEAEKHITSRTRAIVPVHVYGHPCDVEGFARLGEKYGLKIIYDAAHAFGVRLHGRSIASYGDASMFSLHPTKLFHSGEGGLLVFKDPMLQKKIDELKNFAIKSETVCIDVGTNAKMNELNALMGLCCLEDVDALIEKRRAIHATYREAFKGCDAVEFLDVAVPGLEPNRAHCPILFKDFETRERIYEALKSYNVFARRYFYPTLTEFRPYVDARGTCPIADEIASRVLTLPTYYTLALEDAQRIAEIVKVAMGYL